MIALSCSWQTIAKQTSRRTGYAEHFQQLSMLLDRDIVQRMPQHTPQRTFLNLVDNIAATISVEYGCAGPARHALVGTKPPPSRQQNWYLLSSLGVPSSPLKESASRQPCKTHRRVPSICCSGASSYQQPRLNHILSALESSATDRCFAMNTSKPEAQARPRRSKH